MLDNFTHISPDKLPTGPWDPFCKQEVSLVEMGRSLTLWPRCRAKVVQNLVKKPRYKIEPVDHQFWQGKKLPPRQIWSKSNRYTPPTETVANKQSMDVISVADGKTVWIPMFWHLYSALTLLVGWLAPAIRRVTLRRPRLNSGNHGKYRQKKKHKKLQLDSNLREYRKCTGALTISSLHYTLRYTYIQTNRVFW